MNLAVRRLRTRIVSPAPVESHRLAAWHDEIARLDGDAIASRWVGPDEWLLIRQLPLHLRWRGAPVDREVGSAWSAALDQSIAAALERDDGNCVRYAGRRAALADLVYRSALRDTARQWAWHRMDLIPRATMASEEVLRAGVAQLLQAPELVWPVAMRLVAGEEHAASLTAALRALPEPDWMRLFEACPRTAAYVVALDESWRPPPGDASKDSAPPALAQHPAVQGLLRWAAARPHFVLQHRDVLTVLLCALGSAGERPSGATAQARVASVRRQLDAMLPRPAAAGPARAERAKPLAPLAAADEDRPPPRERVETQEPPPELPEPQTWFATAWGGALFWLRQLDGSGVPQRLALAGDALPLFLRELALALGVAPGDAVLAAFCGGELPSGEAAPAISAEAQALSAQWECWLAEAAPELAAPRVATVCRRGGRLRMEPGWIELHLPLREVDTSIRRLALDLDPGWLPWLGCVVRIVYDEA